MSFQVYMFMAKTIEPCGAFLYGLNSVSAAELSPTSEFRRHCRYTFITYKFKECTQYLLIMYDHVYNVLK